MNSLFLLLIIDLSNLVKDRITAARLSLWSSGFYTSCHPSRRQVHLSAAGAGQANKGQCRPTHPEVYVLQLVGIMFPSKVPIPVGL